MTLKCIHLIWWTLQKTLRETAREDSLIFYLFLPLSLPPVIGSGILLFVFHANFLNEITARLCGPCSVHAVVLNDKFQLPIFLVGSKQKSQTVFFRYTEKTTSVCSRSEVDNIKHSYTAWNFHYLKPHFDIISGNFFSATAIYTFF